MRVIKAILLLVCALLGGGIAAMSLKAFLGGKMPAAAGVAVGAALLAYSVIRLVLVVLQRDDAPVPLMYSVQGIRNRPASTAATAVGIALVVAIFVGALAMANGFRAALVATGSEDNVIVLRKGADSELSSGITLERAAIIRSLNEIAVDGSGHPLVSAEVVVNTNKPRLGQAGSSNVNVRGIDLSGLALRGGVKIVDGRMFTPGAGEVIVGKRITNRFANCKIGDTIRFGTRDVKVVGLFTAGGSAFESEIWGDNKVLMPLFRGDVYQSITFRLKDPAQFAGLKARLEKDPRLQVDVKREIEFYADQSNGLTTLLRVAGIFISLIMAVGAIFAAMNTMFAAVGARTREIAVLLTLGFTPGSVRNSFLLESVLLSMIGGALGCVLALPINGLTTSTTNFASFSEVAFAFQVTPSIMLFGILFSMVMGLVGGVLPARRASRQQLATALRAM